MATGPEHYRAAEQHIGFAQNADAPDVEALHLGYAQAHATLALAAAAAMRTLPPDAATFEAWRDAMRTNGAQAALSPLSSTPLAVAFGAAEPENDETTDGDDPADAYTDAELDGRACIACGHEFVNVVTEAILEGPRGVMFAHADPDDCRKAEALAEAEQQAAKDAEAADDVYTAEERADDDAWAEAATDYAATPEGNEADR